MRAVVLTDVGGPEVLAVAEVADPVPGPDEVVVEVVSSALNRADVLQRRGRYPGAPVGPGETRPVEIPGLELAGRVVAVGTRARAWAIGDAVMGIVAGGAHAERVVTHERQLVAVPTTLGLADAGAVPEVWMTAFDALFVQGGLTAGRVALVHAGASGVGTAAIQLAKAAGARIVVTTSAAKVGACLDLGADVAVDRASGDFVEACAEFTGGAGVDVVLDVVGAPYLERNLRSLRVGGRIVQVGLLGGARPEVPLDLLMTTRASLIGTMLRIRPLEEKIALTQRFGQEVVPLFGSGRYRPIIDARFSLDDIADAHRHLESDSSVGKVVLDVAPDPLGAAQPRSATAT